MERLGRITTSLPDLPIDRRMTYGAMRRAIVGLPVTVSSAILPDGLWGCYDAATEVILIDRRLHIHGQTVHSRARALALAAWRHRLCEQ